MLHLRFGDATREDDRIEWELLRPVMAIEEVEGEDESGGEQCLVAVDDMRHVDDPTRNDAADADWEPHYQARQANHRDAPKDRHVIELLPVRETIEGGARTFTNEPLGMGDKVAQILQVRCR